LKDEDLVIQARYKAEVHLRQALLRARRLAAPAIESDVLMNLGRLYRSQPKRLMRAGQCFASAVQRLEEVRQTLSEDLHRAGLMHRGAYPYVELAKLCAKQRHLQSALEIAERARSRTLLEALGQTDLSIPSTLPADLQRRERELSDKLRQIAHRLRHAAEQERISLTHAHRNTLREFTQLEVEIAVIAPDYADLRRGLPLTFTRLREILVMG
jgi:hypothetical protein